MKAKKVDDLTSPMAHGLCGVYYSSNMPNYIYGIDVLGDIYWDTCLSECLSPLFSMSPETRITLVITDGDWLEGGDCNIPQLLKEMENIEGCIAPADFSIEGVYAIEGETISPQN